MKLFNAQAAAKQVTVDGLPVLNAEIIGAGVAPSQGVLLIDEDRVAYIPISFENIEKTIELIMQLCDTVGNGVAAANVGGPIAPTLKADMTALKAQFAALKGALK